MAFSQKDLERHLDILKYLSDVFSTISKNLDLIIAAPYRNPNLLWPDVFNINLGRIEELRKFIEHITEYESNLLELHGLVGIELNFKYELIINSYTKFQEYYVSYSGLRKKIVKPTLRKWLIRFLSLINPYLASLETIFPVAGAIKEFKEFVEKSIGVSEKY